MSTTVEIDDELMARAMTVSGLKTEKEVVDCAVSEFVRSRTRKNLADLRGKIRFVEGYDYKALREDRG